MNFNCGERKLASDGVLRPLLFSYGTSRAETVQDTVQALESRWADTSASSLWQQEMHDTHIAERKHVLQSLEEGKMRQLQNGIDALRSKLQAAEMAQEQGSKAQSNRRQALKVMLQNVLDQEVQAQSEREQLRNEIMDRMHALSADEARCSQTIANLEESKE